MKKAIGIDLGSYSVKLSVLDKTNDYFYVKHKKSYIVPRDSDINYIEWLKSIIRDFMKENRISKADICFSVTAQPPRIITRFLEMPWLNKKELAQSMIYEITEKTLIEDVNSIFYKWSILKHDSETSNILLVIMEKDFINDLKRIKSSKWKINVIEPQIVSAGRLITGNVGVIDFGHSGTRFIVYESGKPCFFKEINIGGKDLTQKIANFYGELRFIEDDNQRLLTAERLKHEKGCILSGYEELESDPVSKELSFLLEDLVQNLANEIKQVFRMFEVREDYAFEKLYYTGEGAKLRYLVNFIERELNFDLEPLNFSAYDGSEESDTEENLQDESSLYIFASGAAIYNNFAYLKDLNFANIKSYDINSKNLFAGVLAFSILFCSGLLKVESTVKERLAEANSIISKQQQKLNEIQQQINAANAVIADYTTLESSIRFIFDQKKWLSDILYILPSYTPDGVVINSLTIKDGQIVISGYARDYSQIGFFAIYMEKIGRVEINRVEDMTDKSIYISKSGDLTKQFTISFYPNGTVSPNALQSSESSLQSQKDPESSK